MKKIKITATFVGGNSLGYVHDKQYEFEMCHTKEHGIMTVINENEDNEVIYESALSFLANWDNIKHIK